MPKKQDGAAAAHTEAMARYPGSPVTCSPMICPETGYETAAKARKKGKTGNQIIPGSPMDFDHHMARAQVRYKNMTPDIFRIY